MPQIDDYVLDTLMRDLAGHDRRPAAYLVFLWLTGEQSRRKSSVAISYGELAESTGLSRSSAQSAVRWLIRRKLLASIEGKRHRDSRVHGSDSLAQPKVTALDVTARQTYCTLPDRRSPSPA